MMENRFVVEQKSLVSILSSMQPICSKRTTLDATTTIYFQVGPRELVLKSTDLEISLQASCTFLESDVVDERSFLVDGRKIFEIIKELEGSITFTITDNRLSLTAGTVNLSLNIKDIEQFPPFPERIENLMQLDAKFLLSMLSKVAFLIPQNNANRALNGLFLEVDKNGLKMTTTDGHCLAQVTTPKYTLDELQKWIMPRRAVLEVKKILEGTNEEAVFLGTCNKQLVFSGESFNFFTKLLVDTFPEYTAILDKENFLAASVDRAHFVKTLRRSSCLLSGQFIATKFDFTKDALNVSLQNKEVGELEEKLLLKDFGGKKLEIRFYAPYLLSGLQAFSEQDIMFHLQSAAKPIIFESKQKESDLVYLVMPVSPVATK